jgi:hypothetical protein
MTHRNQPKSIFHFSVTMRRSQVVSPFFSHKPPERKKIRMLSFAIDFAVTRNIAALRRSVYQEQSFLSLFRESSHGPYGPFV